MKAISLLLIALITWGCSSDNRSPIRAPGVVDGDIITLKALVAGTVESLPVREGSDVTSAQVLARINGEKVKNQLEGISLALSELNLNRQRFQKKQQLLQANQRHLAKQVGRFRRLNQDQAIAGEKLEAMELKLLEAETSLYATTRTLATLTVQEEKLMNERRYLELLLGDHTLAAPVNGNVLETFISEGETVFPGTPVMDILDVSTMFVEIFIEEREIAALRLNQKVRIEVDGMPEREYRGVITFFGRKAEFSPKYVISEQEREALLYRVKVSIQDDPGVFKIGMPVTVLLERSGEG